MRTIRILAFQGTGPRYAGYLDPTDNPLLITGHVGLQPETTSIYGLHPPEWAIQEEGGLEATLQRLRGRRGQPKDMPGTIQDDTYVFHLAGCRRDKSNKAGVSVWVNFSGSNGLRWQYSMTSSLYSKYLIAHPSFALPKP